jgi:coenzyme F420-reducing hydrogenase alpha subunit
VTTLKIRTERLTRCEGHGRLILRAADGGPPAVSWEINESPRFFEAMMRGRPWLDAHVLASRVCGICSVSHLFASLQATEAAFGIVPSAQTLLLRKLLYAGEMLESHMLHIYLLAGPDFFGAGSVIPLLEKDPEAVMPGLRLKRLGNEIMERIGGRSIHPQSPTLAKWLRLPAKETLRHLRGRLDDAMPDIQAAVRLFRGVPVPAFSRPTEYIALKHPPEYALLGGHIHSTDTGAHPLDDYLAVTNEYVAPPSTAKFTRHARTSYAVGALARLKVNYDLLHPLAKQVAQELGVAPSSCNPFMNTLAQIVECAHEIEEAGGLIDRLLQDGLREEDPAIPVAPGRGVGAVEAPRGLLVHDYTYDGSGRITHANLIIPTGQNNGSIRDDLEALVAANPGMGEDELRRLCEMLIRSYDPCVGCASH